MPLWQIANLHSLTFKIKNFCIISHHKFWILKKNVYFCISKINNKHKNKKAN